MMFDQTYEIPFQFVKIQKEVTDKFKKFYGNFFEFGSFDAKNYNPESPSRRWLQLLLT